MNYFILSCIIAAWIIGMGTVILILINKHFNIKRELLIDEKSLMHQRMIINNSNDLLEFTRSTIAQIAVIKMRTFKDSRDISKVTSANIESLAKELADESFKSINVERFYEDHVLFSTQYYMDYIVNTSIVLIKELLEKVINDTIEEEGN